MDVLKSNTPFLLQEMWGSLGRAVAPAELQVNGAHGWVQGICWALALALVQSPHSPGERRLLGLAVEKAGQPAGCWQADPKLRGRGWQGPEPAFPAKLFPCWSSG